MSGDSKSPSWRTTPHVSCTETTARERRAKQQLRREVKGCLDAIGDALPGFLEATDEACATTTRHEVKRLKRYLGYALSLEELQQLARDAKKQLAALKVVHISDAKAEKEKE